MAEYLARRGSCRSFPRRSVARLALCSSLLLLSTLVTRAALRTVSKLSLLMIKHNTTRLACYNRIPCLPIATTLATAPSTGPNVLTSHPLRPPSCPRPAPSDNCLGVPAGGVGQLSYCQVRKGGGEMCPLTCSPTAAKLSCAGPAAVPACSEPSTLARRNAHNTPPSRTAWCLTLHILW